MHIITHQSTSIHSREALPAPIPLTDELLLLPKNGNHDTEKFFPCLFASKIVNKQSKQKQHADWSINGPILFSDWLLFSLMASLGVLF